MDKVKHFLELARKHHFWILCGVSAVVGLLVWFMSTKQLAEEFNSNSAKIKSVKDGLNVSGEQAHADWPTGMSQETTKVRQSVWKAWSELYKNQKENVFVWPKDQLRNKDFLEATAQLEADKPYMSVQWCEYYQNNVKNQVRQLAKIVDAAPLGEEASPMPVPTANGQPPAAPLHKVNWEAGSQQDISDSFDWTEAPNPLLVKYAQEELWVYQALCKIVAEVNKDATGSHDAPITGITDMAIAYAAADEVFGGQGEKRLEDIPNAAPAAAAEQAPASGDATARPQRPSIKARGKKGGDARQMLSSSGTPDAASADPDAIWKNWRYVFGTDDSKRGTPMMAPDVDASKDDEYKLMPFRLILRADPHYLDRLLVAFRNSLLPIEVQQVRMGPQISGSGPTGSSSTVGGSNPLNARYAGSGSGGGDHSERASSGSSSQQTVTNTNVQHERTQAVEIRGVVYLLNPPKAEKLHLNANGEAGGADEQPAPAAPAGVDTAAVTAPDGQTATN